ncbi:acid phosphatase [Jongsikchunia kroppenstedtii]|uniref:acid phosphatase n=1 Tax=Jongsikchunia kroppenstedtii TaxID=1121721 RepID=UPI000476C970
MIVIRHGETAWSLAGRHTGTTDIDLTERGAGQADSLAAPLLELRPVDPLVLSSPRHRTLATLERAGLSVERIDDRLAEWDYGDYEGLTSAQIRQDRPDWTIFTDGAPGGESVAQVTARVDGLLAEIAPTIAAGRDVIAASHGHLSRVLIARWLRQPVTFGASLSMLPASMAVLGTDHGGVAQLSALGITGYASAGYSGR